VFSAVWAGAFLPSPMIDVPVASSLDASIRQRLRVETLLADLSAAFVKIPADQIDSQIEFALKQVVEALGIERSGFGTLSADGALSITHSYEVPGFPPSPRVIVDQELPWYASGGNSATRPVTRRFAARGRERKGILSPDRVEIQPGDSV
jgi:hypothetical protein